MIEYICDKKKLDKAKVLSFILDLDKDFVPRLSQKVDIYNWVDKLFSLAYVTAAMQDDNLVGLVVFYANDKNFYKGYITYVAVSPLYRKQGLATNLLQYSFDTIKNVGMKTIGIHTNNVNAMNLYRKVGFKLVSQQPLPEYDLTRFYLEKQL